MPWARHGAGHTRDFDDTAAWLALQCSKTAVTALLRITWRTVGSIVARVGAEIDASVDRLEGLRRVGIDEISYNRGHRYLTVVVCHDSGRLVWAAPGRDKATLRRFFDQLGEARSAQITHVSADQADWIAAVVAERCDNAVLCADPYHVVAWATSALDEVRRQAWNEARGAVNRRRAPQATGKARMLKHARYALWKNPDNLTERQREKLAWVAKTDPRLHRAYLLKEGLRLVFQLKGQAGKDALDRWISWARRCRIDAFVKLQRRIVKHRAAIDATLDHGLSQGAPRSSRHPRRRLANADAREPTDLLSRCRTRDANQRAHGRTPTRYSSGCAMPAPAGIKRYAPCAVASATASWAPLMWAPGPTHEVRWPVTRSGVPALDRPATEEDDIDARP